MNPEIKALLAKLEYPDKLEVGTPATGGTIRISGNFDDLEEFKEKIDKALDARSYARARLAAEGTGV